MMISFQKTPPYTQPPLPPIPPIRNTPPPLPPPNRIPTSQFQQQQQQNINHQTPKTTINLLNDFYERHLLNQTKFEQKQPGISIPAPPSQPPPPSISSAASSVSSSSLGNYHLNRHQNAVQNIKIESNNSTKNFNTDLMAINGLQYNRSQLQYQYRRPFVGTGERHFGSIPMVITSSSLASQLQLPNMTSSSHTVTTKKNEMKSEHFIGASMNEGKFGNGDNKISELGMIDALKYRRRNISYDINNKDEKMLRRATPIGGNLSEREFIEGCNSGNMMIKNRNSSSYCQPATLENVVVGASDTVMTMDSNGCVDVEYRNSKINLMVETAQAISAASYYARYVEFFF